VQKISIRATESRVASSAQARIRASLRSAMLFVILLGFASGLNAAPSAKPDSATTQAAQAEREIAVLRGQLETMRQYDQRLLTTVYWSLGGLLTVAVLLIGFGWYANFRVYERDKAALSDALRLDFENKVSIIQKELQATTAEGIDRAEKAAVSAAESAARALRSELSNQLSRVNKTIHKIQYDLLRREAEEWIQKKVPKNVLRTYGQMLDTSLHLDAFWVSQALDGMHSALAKFKEVTNPALQPDAVVSRLLGK